MSSYSSKPKKSTYASANIPLLQWIMAIGVALFILIFPYNQGLFNGYAFNFENKIYPALIFVYVVLFLSAIHILQKGDRSLSHRTLLSIAVMLLPVVYWLSSFHGVAPYYANFMTMIVFAGSGLFVAALYAGEKWQARKVIEYALMLASYILVLIGLLVLFGQIYLVDGMWLSNTGYRLTSVFQYSNTYGGFLIALFFAALYYTTHCKRWYMSLLHSLMLVPIWVSFMLSYSRGAIVIIPVILLVLTPFLKLSRQLLYIVYMVISVIVSMAFIGKLTTNSEKISAIVQPTSEHAADTISMFSSPALQSWLLLLAAMVISSAVIMHIQVRWSGKWDTKTQKLAERRGSFLYVPGIIIILGVIAVALLLTNNPIRSLLPTTLEERLASINFNQHSVLERWTFYEDGFTVSEDYPVLGAGGGAWQALFQQYQNNPYWSKQAHSYFVQTLVEVGWIGLIVLLAILVYSYLLYIRFYMKHPERRGSHLVFFIFSFSLLLHSAIDFDMSYVYLSFLVFICLGAMLAPYSDLMKWNKTEKETDKKAAAEAKSKGGNWGKYAFGTVIGAVAIVLFICSVKEVSANRSYLSAVQMATNTSSIQKLLVPLDKAIEQSPSHTQFSILKIDWLQQVYKNNQEAKYLQEALQTVNEAKKLDPYNRTLVLDRYQLLKLSGDTEGMLAELEDGLDKFRWDITIYEAAVVEYVMEGSKDPSKQEQYWSRAKAIGDEVQRRIDQLKNLPPEQLQGREFDFTDQMKQALNDIK